MIYDFVLTLFITIKYYLASKCSFLVYEHVNHNSYLKFIILAIYKDNGNTYLEDIITKVRDKTQSN